MVEALQPGRLVLLAGASKVGKTRTAFEAVRRAWPDAVVAVPVEGRLADLAAHPRLKATFDPVIVWLDDLERFLTGSDPLTPTLESQLLARPGPTIMIGTLQSAARQRLEDASELNRNARTVLQAATIVELVSTSNDSDEQHAASFAYPDVQHESSGLGERLGYARKLLNVYRESADSDPLVHIVVSTAIDWTRSGIFRPMTEVELLALSTKRAWEWRPDLDIAEQSIKASIERARTKLAHTSNAYMIRTVALSRPIGTRGYRAYDYLIAADDGQAGEPRPMPGRFIDQILEHSNADHALAVATVAYRRGDTVLAERALLQAAKAGNHDAGFNLGVLFSEESPPNLLAAQEWYERTAAAGNTNAMNNLGGMCLDQMPRDLVGARQWYRLAADAGNAAGAYNLALLLSNENPVDLGEAKRRYEQAADAGNIGAAHNLGVLLMRETPPDRVGAKGRYKQAAAGGHVDAMNNLAALLLDETPRDVAGAKQLLQQAADAGNIGASYNLAVLMLEDATPQTAVVKELLGRAVKAGFLDAFNNLGVLLLRESPPKLDEAIELFQRAADAGHSKAMYNLGRMLLREAPPKVAEAKRLLQQASAAGNAGAASQLERLRRLKTD